MADGNIKDKGRVFGDDTKGRGNGSMPVVFLG
jgi:hypothetical protein